jgi:S1-C subfamily serine protease
MNWKTFVCVVVFVLTAAILCSPRKAPAQEALLGEPTLRLTAADGRVGSAIHIGNGFAITAAHVVDGLTTVNFRSDKSVVDLDAEVLWANDAYDVALIRLSSTPNITRAPVTCREAVRGEPIKAYGNPLGLPFFETSGMISIAIPATIDRWKSSIVFSAPIAGGMSGGPLLDVQGHLLGIIVGSVGRVAPFGVAVPVATICSLLGRA